MSRAKLNLIGVDYGREMSVAVVARWNDDGSLSILDVVEGKGLDEFDHIGEANEMVQPEREGR